MTEPDSITSRRQETLRTLEISIRLAVILGLIVWCFQIVEPFLSTVVWSIVIAVALFPGYEALLRRITGHRKLVTLSFTLGVLLLIMTPVVLLSGTLIEAARTYATELQSGNLEVPPPPEDVRDWPVVGQSVYDGWELAHENISAALARLQPQIRRSAGWLVSTAAGAGLGILQFALAILIAGFLLGNHEVGMRFAHALGRRLADEKGEEFVELASSTVRSVAQGVLGVAFIQAMLAGLGFLFVGLPGAGLWTLICLITAVVQLGVGLVVIPSVIYVFSTADTTTAVIYLLWAIFVTIIDNILKPLFLGRGSPAPMVVIFVGAIGGFILSGIVGLFVGAVVLVMGYELFTVWLYRDESSTPDANDPSPRPM